MSEPQWLPPGPFIRLQAEAITRRYHNIAIEDDQGGHFRLVVRDPAGWMVWRAPDAGEVLNRYIRQYGIRADASTRRSKSFTR